VGVARCWKSHFNVIKSEFGATPTPTLPLVGRVKNI
jgi:hypothetical protein